jgi:hypothetical protein
MMRFMRLCGVERVAMGAPLTSFTVWLWSSRAKMDHALYEEQRCVGLWRDSWLPRG